LTFGATWSDETPGVFLESILKSILRSILRSISEKYFQKVFRESILRSIFKKYFQCYFGDRLIGVGRNYKEVGPRLLRVQSLFFILEGRE